MQNVLRKTYDEQTGQGYIIRSLITACYMRSSQFVYPFRNFHRMFCDRSFEKKLKEIVESDKQINLKTLDVYFKFQLHLHLNS
jgi:hypothetical protein